MSENPETPTKPIIVNDPIDLPATPGMLVDAAGKRATARGRVAGVLGVPTRTAREKTPMNTLLRRNGINVAGVHPTDDRGQYDASKNVGPNESCPCNWAAEHPHKYKRHGKVAGPLIRAALDEALARAKAKEAAKATEVPTVPVEPTVG